MHVTTIVFLIEKGFDKGWARQFERKHKSTSCPIQMFMRQLDGNIKHHFEQQSKANRIGWHIYLQTKTIFHLPGIDYYCAIFQETNYWNINLNINYSIITNYTWKFEEAFFFRKSQIITLIKWNKLIHKS